MDAHHPHRNASNSTPKNKTSSANTNNNNSTRRTNNSNNSMRNTMATGGLHAAFTHTANALASLYKQSLTAERDARDAGARLAYNHVMQWAGRIASSGGSISVADVISLCGAELSRLPQPPIQQHQQQQHSSPSQQTQQQQPTKKANVSKPLNSDNNNNNNSKVTQAYIARDEGLASDIKRLNVNPRKRQRVEISEAFMKACLQHTNENETRFLFNHVSGGGGNNLNSTTAHDTDGDADVHDDDDDADVEEHEEEGNDRMHMFSDNRVVATTSPSGTDRTGNDIDAQHHHYHRHDVNDRMMFSTGSTNGNDQPMSHSGTRPNATAAAAALLKFSKSQHDKFRKK